MSRVKNKSSMNRVFSVDPNRKFTMKNFEAPNAWQRYPKACRRLTSTAVYNSKYHDKARLYSALIRIVRRKMTFNEASASHKISLTLIKTEWPKIFKSMSEIMMKLINEDKKDLELSGGEMDEAGFPYEKVTEEDLITITAENGEEFAIVDPKIRPPLASGDADVFQDQAFSCEALPKAPEPLTDGDRLAMMKEPDLNIYKINGRPDVFVHPKYEEAEYEELDSFSSTSQNNSSMHQYITPKEEEIDFYPSHQTTLNNHYVVPKEEQPFSNDLVEPKIEEEEPYSFEDQLYPHEDEVFLLDDQAIHNHQTNHQIDNHQTDYQMGFEMDHGLEHSVKFEGDLGTKYIKTEDKMEPIKQKMKDPVMSKHTDKSLLACSMRDFGYTDPMDEEEAQEEDYAVPQLPDPEEEDNPEILEAIGMGLKSSKLVGEAAYVMKEALKDIIIRQVSIVDAAQMYGFPDSQPIMHLLNKTRLFLKSIWRRSGKELPDNFTAFTREFTPGPPLDRSDKKRINTIHSVINSLVKRCMYTRGGKDHVRAALSAVCLGELTLNAAANKYNLPSSTIHPYIHKARARLGDILPPQATMPNTYQGILTKRKHSEIEESVPRKTCPTTGKVFYRMEEVDQTIIDILTTSSQYDTAGKQGMFESVIAVITEGISCNIASSKTGIPTATIQHYVCRVKTALEIPSDKSRVEFVPRKREPPTMALRMHQNIASREEVDRVAKNILRVMPNTGRRDSVYRAVMLAVMGEKTIREAAAVVKLPASTVHPYATKVRLALGDKCPQGKTIASVKTQDLSRRGERIDDSLSITINEDEIVDVDGIKTPKSIRLLTRLITLGKINYNKAIPFLGTKEELYEKLLKILVDFNYKGDVRCLAKGIMYVYVEDKSILDACIRFKITQTTLASYVRAVKVFIDFSNSPCTNEYQAREYDEDNAEKPSYSSKNEILDPFPTAPPSEMTEEFREELRKAVQQEKMDVPEDGSQEEHEDEIDPTSGLTADTGLLTKDELRKDAKWEGDGMDQITRKLTWLYEMKKWKFDTDDIRSKNAKLITTLFTPHTPDENRLNRLKVAAQYVINERAGGTRETLYLRPILIHHLCNGFSLEHLLHMYGTRVTANEAKMEEYAAIATQMYQATGAIIFRLVIKLTKLNRMLDVSRATESMQDELDQMNKDMIKEFPFLANPRVIPATSERLAKEEVKRRKNGVDIFVFCGLQALKELREIGFLLTDCFAREVVHLVSYNISPSFINREYVEEWVSNFMYDIIRANSEVL